MGQNQGTHGVAPSGDSRPAFSFAARFRRLLPVWLVLLVGGLLALVVFVLVRGYEQKREKDAFGSFAQAHALQLQRRLEADLEVLLSIQQLYAATPEVEPDEFRDFVRGPLQRHEEILSLEWVARVSAADRPAFEIANAAAIVELTERGGTTTAQPRAEYFAVNFVEPLEGNRASRGFDHASAPHRRAAMQQARDTGGAVLTAPTKLFRDRGPHDALACMIFAPIYSNNLPHGTLEERREHLRGFAAGTILLSGLVKASLTEASRQRMDLFLYDRTPSERIESLLHYQRGDASAAPRSFREERGDPSGPVFWADEFNQAGRTWAIVCRPTPQYVRDGAWESWVVLVGGLLITILLGGYLHHVLYSAASVEEQVSERTRELAATNVRLHNEMAERSRAEDALRSSEARVRLIVDKAHDAFVAMDSKGNIIEWNMEASHTFGWSREEVLGRVLAETIIPLQFREAHARGLARFLATGEGPALDNRLELTGLHRNGHEFPLELTISVIQSGSVRFFAAFIRDITQRKRAEQALQNSEALYHSLVESLPLSILRKDLQGRVTFGNRRYCQAMGKPFQQLLGQSDHDLFAPELANKYVADDQKVVATREVFEDIEEHRSPQGDRRFVHVLKGPVFDAKQEVVGTQVIFWDVTERKEAEEKLKVTTTELARSNAELQQFAYVASHDLQEPLRTIVNFLQLLSRRYPGKLDAEAEEYIGFAVDGAKRMQVLIKDLLDYSRVGTKGAPFEAVDTARCYEAALANLNFAVEESGARISRGPLPTVRADEMQITQLFQNLIGNAIKFSRDKPPVIEVSAERAGAAWRFAVRDHGIGIEPRHFDRIFVIFQRLHTRDEYPGTGIGLALCKKIVERHGGRIWVESQPGQGSAFQFTVPVLK